MGIIERFSSLAYEFYPKDINYFNSDYFINPMYQNSKENLRLISLRDKNFDKDKNYANLLINLIQDKNKLELRDVSNIHMGDRAFNIQHSGFFCENKLKYYPICFVFSALIPYYYYYIVDIDIYLKNEKRPITYGWKKNNGIIIDYNNHEDFKDIIDSIKLVINEKTEYRIFPKEIIWEALPNLCNENINFGKFTFFNAFFMDDFYCFP